MGNCLGCWRDAEQTAESLHILGADSWTQYNAPENKGSADRPGYLASTFYYYTEALRLVGRGDPLYATILIDLTSALQLNEEGSSRPEVEALFESLADAQILPFDHGQLHIITANLGGYYERLWETSLDEMHFERCVANYNNAALHAITGEDRMNILLAVAELHIRRKEKSHYEKALEVFSSALSAHPQTVTERYKIAEGMYEIHKILYDGGRDKAHLESAIAQCGSALDLPLPQERPLRLLFDYVRCVWVLFDKHEITPISSGFRMKAIYHGREALQLLSKTPGHSDIKFELVIALANILSFPGADLRPSDFEEALHLYERAEVIKPMDGNQLGKMGDVVWQHCRRTNNFDGLEAAIGLFRRAYDLVAEPVRAIIAFKIATIYLEKAKSDPDLELAREYYSMAEKDALTEDDKLRFAKLGDDALRLKDLAGVRWPGQRKRPIGRKATMLE
ncbi:hypothetical protein D9611_011460 [Ephemerocybe angulata]|uniref:Uncharacterized protein n=1 Tax=Ephemerocybe angulata TaxID=980116 RepID=A0A8H5FKB2_9AGAR|nr:hypothetical protein D9611_011460 [Tulosesus angulatus]